MKNIGYSFHNYYFKGLSSNDITSLIDEYMKKMVILNQKPMKMWKFHLKSAKAINGFRMPFREMGLTTKPLAKLVMSYIIMEYSWRNVITNER